MRHVLESIREWFYPAADEMPNDPVARCEWYARRLLLIANATRTRCAKAEKCLAYTGGMGLPCPTHGACALYDEL
jgi:hypothetical protein